MRISGGICSDKGLIVLGLLLFSIPTAILAGIYLSNQQTLWTFSTYGIATAVAVSSDGSYVAAGIESGLNKGQVILLNEAGSRLWVWDSTSMIASVAITPDGLHVAAAGLYLYSTSNTTVPGEVGNIYYFDQTGSLLWNYTITRAGGIAGAGPSTPGQLSVMLSSDGSRVIVNTGLGALVLDNKGSVLWSYQTGGFDGSSTLSSGDGSFIVTVDGQAHAFNEAGISLWNSTSLPAYPDTEVMSPDGRYLALERINNPASVPSLVLFDRSGAKLWNRTLSGFASLAISNDGGVIFVGSNAWTAAINASQGGVLWNTTRNDANRMAAGTNGSYVAAVSVSDDSDQNTLRILNNQGGILWSVGAFGYMSQMVLSSTGSHLAVALGPGNGSPYAKDSAVIFLLPGPGRLATERGQTYSILFVDPNTQDSPIIFLVPLVFGLVPFLYLFARRWKKARLKAGPLEARPVVV